MLKGTPAPDPPPCEGRAGGGRPQTPSTAHDRTRATLLPPTGNTSRPAPRQVPIYDFKTSSRAGYTTLPVPASRIVIIEGIYALSEKLRPLLDLRVSITGGGPLLGARAWGRPGTARRVAGAWGPAPPSPGEGRSAPAAGLRAAPSSGAAEGQGPPEAHRAAAVDRPPPHPHRNKPRKGGVHFDLVKRVMRDITRSGQGPEEIIQQVGGGPSQP